jgi:hypothetical protein
MHTKNKPVCQNLSAFSRVICGEDWLSTKTTHKSTNLSRPLRLPTEWLRFASPLPLQTRVCKNPPFASPSPGGWPFNAACRSRRQPGPIGPNGFVLSAHPQNPPFASLRPSGVALQAACRSRRQPGPIGPDGFVLSAHPQNPPFASPRPSGGALQAACRPRRQPGPISPNGFVLFSRTHFETKTQRTSESVTSWVAFRLPRRPSQMAVFFQPHHLAPDPLSTVRWHPKIPPARA